ncbi:hypothetical protein Deval_1020 [Nitratidesulfovibrio vulgaris RCH1]|nr:hypothetical protein Deval_1020 [Nitratidesulfovibrio vulgaris RCH1]
MFKAIIPASTGTSILTHMSGRAARAQQGLCPASERPYRMAHAVGRHGREA